MKFSLEYSAYLLLILAILAWGAIYTEGNTILDEASSRAVSASSAQQTSDRLAHSQRLSSLIADTKRDRTALDESVNHNIVSIVTMIEGVGKQAGVAVKVNNAAPEGDARAFQGQGQMQTFAFTAEAEGSYTNLMKIIQQYENLPIPSSIEQVELSHSVDTSGGSWHLSIRIRVLTTAASS